MLVEKGTQHGAEMQPSVWQDNSIHAEAAGKHPMSCNRGQQTRRPAWPLTPVLGALQVKKGTQLGKEMESIMKEGKLVPTEVTVKLLRKAMQASSNDKFLIDGFPRAIDQAETFERDVKPPGLVLFFDCPEVGWHPHTVSLQAYISAACITAACFRGQ